MGPAGATDAERSFKRPSVGSVEPAKDQRARPPGAGMAGHQPDLGQCGEVERRADDGLARLRPGGRDM